MAYRPQVKTSNDMVDLPIDAETIKGKTLLEQTYPVGAIYLSVNSTSPASLFGGTWERLKDKFLLGAGDTYTNGDTGGSATHNHGLSGGYAMEGLHSNGELWVREKIGITSYNANYKVNANSGGSGANTESAGTQLGGNTDNGNNMPPYLVVYMWKRTA